MTGVIAKLMGLKSREMWAWSLLCQLFILPTSIWYGIETGSILDGFLMWLLLDIFADAIIILGWWHD